MLFEEPGIELGYGRGFPATAFKAFTEPALVAFPETREDSLEIEDSLGAKRDRGSVGLLRVQRVCEYDPVIRRTQCRNDLSLLRQVQPTPVYDDWTVIECLTCDLRFSARVGEKGRGRGTCLANVNLCSEKI